MPTNRPKKPMQMGGGKLTKVFTNPDLAVNGLRMFMMRNAIIMSSRNVLRYTDSFVDALRL